MKDELLAHLRKTASNLGISPDSVVLEYPENPDHGDFSTNIALANAKTLKTSPKALAEKVVAEFKKDIPDLVESVGIAGAGFINFKVKDEAFAEFIVDAERFTQVKRGDPKIDAGTKMMVEYTDPNPFKVFHIGHLMSNAIGESISRLIESSGAKVIRACYQGDVGLHVAKALWGFDNMKDAKSDFKSVTAMWGHAYAFGAKAYEEDPKAKDEIDEINKKLYDHSDPKIDSSYQVGRQQSLEAFDGIYKRLGTKFDRFFFESEVADGGVKAVRESLKKGIFTESDGAVVFKGEDHGLHTRVFITSNGLPTYETKEIGLNSEKFKLYPDLDQSIIVTANEQSEYFKVLLKVFSLIAPKIAEKTRHISHGLMRFASGKMSSRKGNIVSAESLIDEIRDMVKEKMAGRELSLAETDEISDQVAIAAIKYTILRQAIGGDVIFDSATSISFEGDSGPYLQYSAVRAGAVLEKAEKEGIKPVEKSAKEVLPEKAGLLERLITRFPDIVERARAECAPQHVATYLINLAGAFNSFYGNQTVVDAKDPLSPYYVALTRAFLITMTDGLWLLGIKVPKKM